MSKSMKHSLEVCPKTKTRKYTTTLVVLLIVLLTTALCPNSFNLFRAEDVPNPRNKRVHLVDYWPLGPENSYQIPLLSNHLQLTLLKKIYSAPDADGVIKSQEIHGHIRYDMYYKTFNSGIYHSRNRAKLAEKESMFLLPNWATVGQKWDIHWGDQVYQVTFATRYFNYGGSPGEYVALEYRYNKRLLLRVIYKKGVGPVVMKELYGDCSTDEGAMYLGMSSSFSQKWVSGE